MRRGLVQAVAVLEHLSSTGGSREGVNNPPPSEIEGSFPTSAYLPDIQKQTDRPSHSPETPGGTDETVQVHVTLASEQRPTAVRDQESFPATSRAVLQEARRAGLPGIQKRVDGPAHSPVAWRCERKISRWQVNNIIHKNKDSYLGSTTLSVPHLHPQKKKRGPAYLYASALGRRVNGDELR